MARSIPWIDLSAYDLKLHAVQLPSGQRVLCMTGAIEAHTPALIALGFQRSAKGHIVHPEKHLSLTHVQTQFPSAQSRQLPLFEVVRIQPSAAATPSGATALNEPAAPARDLHSAEFLGFNRRCQSVYQDALGTRFLQDDPSTDFGPLSDVDYLRCPRWHDLPDVAEGLVQAALHRGAKLNNSTLEHFARQIDGPSPRDDPHAQTVFHHRLQEALEVAAIRHFSHPAASVQHQLRAGSGLHHPDFVAAVKLSENLPAQKYRSQWTLSLAQYSTPFPLAYAAQAALGPISPGRTLLEPSAGHGALLAGLPNDLKITALELDENRHHFLHTLLPESEVFQVDALKAMRLEAKRGKHYDYVLANPPYGSLREVSDQSQATLNVAGRDFTTKRLDQFFVLQCLQVRHPQGRAVFLLAAEHPRSHDLATPDAGSRYLLNFLADHYKVEAVVGLHGDLYRSKGSSYPLRMVVVGEQGQGFDAVPATTPVVRSWEELWDYTQSLAERLGPSALERQPAASVTIDTPVVTTPATADAATPLVAQPPTTPDALETDMKADTDADADDVIYQLRYEARSQIGQSMSMVPANMATATRKALDRVEALNHTTVDELVAGHLGRDVAHLGQAFSPEQVDALALAIQALSEERGFIEADETGIGKGRVLAGLAQWAWRQEKPVIFLTEKANLFSDFYRDLRHTGAAEQANLLIVNTGVGIKDTERGTPLINAAPAGELKRWIERDELPPSCNLVMCTYSQLNRPFSTSPKAQWLEGIALTKNALIIADESHNAAGASNTYENVRRIIKAGDGVVYSSATFAKRPDNMELYAPVLPTIYHNDRLSTMLRGGGVALQEVFAGMLAEDGVLIRREHDLSNIAFEVLPDSKNVERNRQLSDQLAGILEQMSYLGGDIKRFANEQNEALADTLTTEVENSDQRTGNRLGLQTMNFGSRLYNLNRLFILALKVDAAVDWGVSEMEAGRKPVFVLENTMETMLREIMTQEFGDSEQDSEALDSSVDDDGASHAAGSTGLDLGSNNTTTQPLSYPMMHYRDALERTLDRMMTMTRRDSYGEVVKVPITDERLVALRDHISEQAAQFPDLELSPIDTLRDALEQHGYSCGELSGRKFRLRLASGEEGERIMVVQPQAGTDRSDIIYGFNTHRFDALIMTRSGASGLSLHARNDIPGWSPAPRSLFELQIPANVADRIQFWGRVNRRGQCAPPSVITPSTELPGEARLIAMQNTKLRSLSANTTSNQDNAALTRRVPDILNFIGNHLVREWATQNIHDAYTLEAEPSKERDTMTNFYVNRVMSRIMLFPVIKQEEILSQLTSAFDNEIARYEKSGGSPFRTAEANWGARLDDQEIYDGDPDSDPWASTFLAPVYFSTVKYEEFTKPLRSEQVQELLGAYRLGYNAERLLGQFEDAYQLAMKRAMRPQGNFPGVATVAEGLNDEGENPVKKAHDAMQPIRTFLTDVAFGSTLEWLEKKERENVINQHGIVLKVYAPKAENAHLAGQYAVILAVPGEERLLNRSIFGLNKASYHLSPFEVPLRAFDEAEYGQFTRTRNLLTGNMYTAMQLALDDDIGRPQIYTDSEGHRQRGVLLDPLIGLEDLRGQSLLLRGAGVLARFITDNTEDKTLLVANTDGGGRPHDYSTAKDFVLEINRGELTLTIPGAHSRNASLLHDDPWMQLNVELTGDRRCLSGELTAAVRSEAVAVLERQFSWYAQPQYRDWYTEFRRQPSAAATSTDKPKNDDSTPYSVQP